MFFVLLLLTVGKYKFHIQKKKLCKKDLKLFIHFVCSLHLIQIFTKTSPDVLQTKAAVFVCLLFVALIIAFDLYCSYFNLIHFV